MVFETRLKLRSLAPAIVLGAVIACGNGPGGEPIIPDNPDSGATSGSGGGGMGGTTTVAATTATGTGGAGNMPMPNPAAEWESYGSPKGMQDELHVVAPNEMYAVAEDSLQVGDVIAMYNGSGWVSVTTGAGQLRNAFQYIAPLDPLLDPTQFAAVVGNHIELWDGLAWNIMTPDALGLRTGLHYVDADNIYAPVGEQIQKYDGILGEWVLFTDDVPAPYTLTRAFHWVSDLETYAIVQNGLEGEIMMWDGLAWSAFAPAVEGLKGEMHFVSPTEIYANIGGQICIFNGTTWTPWTDELTSIRPAFSFLGPDDIYAIAGTNQVFHWSVPE